MCSVGEVPVHDRLCREQLLRLEKGEIWLARQTLHGSLKQQNVYTCITVYITCMYYIM